MTRRLAAALLLHAAACLYMLGHVGAAAAGQLDAQWSAPQTNSDGSTLVDLSIYRVYFAPAPTVPCPGSSFIVVAAPSNDPAPNETATGHLPNLITGTSYNIQVTALDIVGNESACSMMATAAARPDVAGLPTPGTNLQTVFIPDVQPPTTITLGEPTIGTVTKGSLGGALTAQPITLVTAVRLLKLSLNVASPAGGRATLGLYTDLNGHPNSLVAGLPSQGLVAGWNTVTLAAPVSLTPGTFWLAATFDSNGTTIPITGSPMPFGFGFTLPSTFPPIQGTIAGHAAFTATVGP